MLHRMLALLIGFITVFPLQAQQLPLRQLTTNDGLPSNAVYQVFQDSKKFIWFATDAGLARYDGDRFVYYSTKNGLNSNEVIRLAEDSHGRIWIFHFNGSFNYYFDGKIYTAKDAPWLSELTVGYNYKNMTEDRGKRLLFYDNIGSDVHILDKHNKVSHFNLPRFLVDHFDKAIPMIGDIINQIVHTEKGYYLFCSGGVFFGEDLPGNFALLDASRSVEKAYRVSDNGVILYAANLKNKNYELLYYDSGQLVDSIAFPNLRTFELIVHAARDSDEHYWVSTFNNGVFCIKADKVVARLPIVKAQNILEDHEGNIWIASLSEGVYQLSAQWNKYTIYPAVMFASEGIRAMAASSKGGIWVHDGRKLFLLKENTIYTSDHTDNSASVDQIEELANGDLLLGRTNDRMIHLKNPLLKNGNLRIGGFESGMEIVKRFVVNRERNTISTFYPFKLFTIPLEGMFQKEQHFTVLSERIFYTYFNQQDQLMVNGRKIYHFTGDSLHEVAELKAFEGKIIRQQLNLPGGVELFNIGGDSLFMLHNGSLINFSLNLDYSMNQVITHLAYGDEMLFVASPNHMYVIEKPLDALKGNLLKVMPLEHRFSNISQLLYYNKNLYISGEEGLIVIPRASIAQTENRPIPYFSGVLVNDSVMAPSSISMKLKGKNKIQFTMGAIHYNPNRIQYAYRLEGTDKEWNVGENHVVVYQDLAPGTYVFRFRVKLPTTEWSETLSYSIVVKPTLVQHPLFYILLAAVLFGLLYLRFIRKRNDKLKALETEHQMLVLEQKALHSMMNPHFIFNALGSIQSYILKNNPSDAGLYLSQFARLIRQNLNAIKTSMISLDEEIDRLRNYLNLERLRMSNRFGFMIDIAQDIDEEVLIPTMILQPIVENAIWHGLSARESDGMIKISFSRNDAKSLRIVVEDNGVGLEQSARQKRSKDSHLQIGMSLTIKRLELIGKKLGVRTGITVMSAHNDDPYPGVRVEIVVPYVLEEGEG